MKSLSKKITLAVFTVLSLSVTPAFAKSPTVGQLKAVAICSFVSPEKASGAQATLDVTVNQYEESHVYETKYKGWAYLREDHYYFASMGDCQQAREEYLSQISNK